MGSMVAGLGIRERRAMPRMLIARCVVRVRRCRWPLWTPTIGEYTAKGLNLSFSGLAFRGREQFRPGEHVLVTLQPMRDGVPAGEGLILRGRVTWCEKPHRLERETTAVRFAGRPEAVRSRISTWAAHVKHLLA